MKPIDVPPIQDTIIKTPKARYLVLGVDAPPIGPTVIKVRQPSWAHAPPHCEGRGPPAL